MNPARVLHAFGCRRLVPPLLGISLFAIAGCVDFSDSADAILQTAIAQEPLTAESTLLDDGTYHVIVRNGAGDVLGEFDSGDSEFGTCSCSPDGFWVECCIAHDVLSQEAVSPWDQFVADLLLADCMNQRGAPGWLYFLGVRLFGGDYDPGSCPMALVGI